MTHEGKYRQWRTRLVCGSGVTRGNGSCEDHIEAVYKCRSMGGLSAKKRMATVGDVVISVGNYKCVSKNLGQ